MAHRFLHLGIAFAAHPRIQELEPAMAYLCHDWVRYAGNCWILWTNKTPQECTTILRQYLDPNDHFLFFPLDYTVFAQGLVPQWVWDWLNKPRPSTALLAPIPLRPPWLPPHSPGQP